MINLSDKDNEWLVTELRLCRAILGMSQLALSELTGMAIQSIKRLEKKGANARYSTIIKLRKAFSDMGVNCTINEDGTIDTVLSVALIEAINDGNIKAYTKQRIEDLLIENDEGFVN